MILVAATLNLYAAPDKMESKLALDGYCPVCYIAADKANKGLPEFTSVLNGSKYQFVSAATKAMFDAEPAKFLPQYDGFCAYGMSLGKKFESDPTVYSVIDGKIYLNKNAEVQKLFAKDTAGLIAKADKEWQTVGAKLALDGYCPVCYIAADQANKGLPEFTSVLNGSKYQFVSAETKAMFDAEPAKFLPQYDGLCAYGMSLGKKFESDPTTYTVIDGKIYLNKNADIKKLFAKDTASLIAKADKAWTAMEMKEKEMMKK